MKTFLISVESRATSSLQITPSGSGEENEVNQTFLERAAAKSRKRRHLVDDAVQFPFTFLSSCCCQQTTPTMNSTEPTESLHLQAIQAKKINKDQSLI